MGLTDSRPERAEARRLSNAQLAAILGAVAVGLFVLALWQYRPM